MYQYRHRYTIHKHTNENADIMMAQCQSHSCTRKNIPKFPRQTRIRERIVQNLKTHWNKQRYNYYCQWYHLLGIYSENLILSTTKSLLKQPNYLLMNIMGESESGSPINSIQFDSINISWVWKLFCINKPTPIWI